jgi:hypothetical protein
MTRCTISDNSNISDNTVGSNFKGGGLCNVNRTTMTLNQCIISGNTSAGNGGGIESSYAPCSTTLNNCTISGNQAGASGYGGGIDILGGTVTLDSCTVVNISFVSGGQGGWISIYNSSYSATFAIKNTIVANNTSATYPDLDNSTSGGVLTNNGNNLVENSSGHTIMNSVNECIVGTDPNAGSLANNGGTTQTHALNAGSAAIDKGNTTLTTDQRGTSRPLGAADANTRIYFQPNANYNGTVANVITFRAWDRTSGANGNTANTTTNGGATAFSAQTDTANIIINAVNDEPSFTVGRDEDILEDAGAQTVSGWAAAISKGASNESSQTLTFTVFVLRMVILVV